MSEYDLSQKKLPKSVPTLYTRKIYTPDEIKDRLRGYIKVPKGQYNNIRYNSHVRYYRADGSFSGGGFVNLSHRPGKDDDKEYMQLKSNMFNGKKGLTWMLDYDNIQELYVQESAELTYYKKQLKNVESQTQEGFNTITDHLKKIYKRIKRLEQNLDNVSVMTGPTVDLNCMKEFEKAYP